MNGFKDDTIIARFGKKTHLFIGKGHLKLVGPLWCHNCGLSIAVRTEIVIRGRGHGVTYKVWCGDCARRLAVI